MINIDRLDDGYETTRKMFSLEKQEGVQLVNDLETLIEKLKEHWIGEDGTNHINRLIEIHDKMQKYILGTLECTKLAMVSVVNLQEVSLLYYLYFWLFLQRLLSGRVLTWSTSRRRYLHRLQEIRKLRLNAIM